MKETCSRARQLKIAISAYGPSRGSRSNHRAREGSRGRTRRVGSGQPVFRRDAVSSLQPCYIWEFRGFFVSLSLLSLCFVIIIKYSRAQRGTQASYPPSSSLSVALGLNGYFGVTKFLAFLSVLFYFLKTHQNPSLTGIQAPMDLGIHLHQE